MPERNLFSPLLTAIIPVVFLFTSGLSGNAFAQSTAVSHTPGVLHIQLTEPAATQLSLVSDENGLLKTGNNQLDLLMQDYGVYEIEPTFQLHPRFSKRHTAHGFDRWYTLSLTQKGDELAAADAFKKNTSIELAEPDYRAVLFDRTPDLNNEAGIGITNDPRFSDQWHYRNTGQTGGIPGSDINLLLAWGITTGTPDVIVQVLDSGINTEHEDLKNMLWLNPEPGASGRIGDIHGWNFRSNNSNITDNIGHGTHVSGTIAAETNNGIGVAGVAGGDGVGRGVRLMIARLFEGNAGPSTQQIANAFAYGADHGAVISNNSWGFDQDGFFPVLVRSSIDYFIDNAGLDENDDVSGPIAGGIVVFASGNDNSDAMKYPGAYSRVVNVAGTNDRDMKAWYSNYGNHIDISAPGGETTGSANRGVLSTDINGYRFLQGTSMAAPHVSGVLGLMASHFPDQTNSQLIQRMYDTVDPIDGINPLYEGKLGVGRLNAYNALVTESPPARPILSFPQSNEEDIQLTEDFFWRNAPMTDSYELQVSTKPTFGFSGLVVDVAGLLEPSYTVSNLQLETEYYWRVRGLNQYGHSRWSQVRQFKTVDREPPELPQLSQNFPNPFNPVTTIEFGLPEDAFVTLDVYNVTGQRVATLISEQRDIGWHFVTFDGTNLASGVYIYRLRANDRQVIRKMLLVK